MALIKCSECGKEISDEAKKCPNCGVKTKMAREKNKIIIKYGIIVVIILLIISSIIVVHNNDVIVKSKRKSITLFQKYKNDDIDTEKLIDELKQLENDIEKLADNQDDSLKSSKLKLLSSSLYIIRIEVQDRYLSWNSHEGTSDSKIDEYVKKIKDL